jgi:two-component system, NarL family, nitrate/nitrite response regulator NarL
VLTMPQIHKLTPRERELVRGITRGRSNREIASELGISEQTVKNQLTVVFQKLHIKNRLELAVYAMRHGLHH